MKKILCLILVFAMMIPFAACTPTANTDGSETKDSETVAPEASSGDTASADTEPVVPTVDSSLKINISVLGGTTGMGMAKLISDKKNGSAALNYNFSVTTKPDSIVSAIVGKTTDIAAAPTNLASTLYKKTNGGVYVLALNTLGVLYLLESGNTINSVSDLKGKTVYIPGEGTNPEYILKYIIEKNGMKVGTDVIFNYSYGSPDELGEAAGKGLVDIALLPEPKVTAVKNQNAKFRTALDITDEWEKKAGKGTLVQGCIIVRKEFADAHPNEIAKFLEEYEASINFVKGSPNEASALIAEAGIIPKAPLALKALPNSNITYIDGAEMKTALSKFYSILFEVNPKAIGGSLPDDGLYYVK